MLKTIVSMFYQCLVGKAWNGSLCLLHEPLPSLVLRRICVCDGALAITSAAFQLEAASGHVSVVPFLSSFT